MNRVVVSNPMIGVYTMQVCACRDATDEEILQVANLHNPSGTTGGWSRVCRKSEDHPDHPAVEGKTLGPIDCSDYPDRQHILLTC